MLEFNFTGAAQCRNTLLQVTPEQVESATVTENTCVSVTCCVSQSTVEEMLVRNEETPSVCEGLT